MEDKRSARGFDWALRSNKAVFDLVVHLGQFQVPDSVIEPGYLTEIHLP